MITFTDISYDTYFEIIKNYKYNKFEIILKLFRMGNEENNNMVSRVLRINQNSIFNIKYEGIKNLYGFLENFEAYWEDKYSILFYLFLYHKKTVFDLIKKENRYIPYDIKHPSKLFQKFVIVPKGKEEEFRQLVVGEDLFISSIYYFEYEGKDTDMIPFYSSTEEYNTPFERRIVVEFIYDIFVDLYPSIYFFKQHILNDNDWIFNDKNVSKLVLWFEQINSIMVRTMSSDKLTTGKITEFYTVILFTIIEEFEDEKKQKIFFHILFYIYYNIIPFTRFDIGVGYNNVMLQELIIAFIGLVNRYYEKFHIPLSLPTRREFSPVWVYIGITRNSSYYLQNLINKIMKKWPITYFKDNVGEIHPSIVKSFTFKQLEVLFFEKRLSPDEFAPELRLFNNTFNEKVFSVDMEELKEISIDIKSEKKEITKRKEKLVDMLKYFMFVNQEEKEIFHKNLLDYIYKI